METKQTANNLSIHEVIIASLTKNEYKETILEFLDFEEIYYYVLQVHFDPNVNYSFPDRIIDDLLTYFDQIDIKEHGNHIENSPTMYGADISAYPPDGSWCAELYEFFDFYIWIEPEGETYGFFNDLNAARSFGKLNWCP